MATPHLDFEKAAKVLVEASYTSDNKAANKYGVTPRTIRNYRTRLDEDENFAEVFLKLKKEADRYWLMGVPEAIEKGVKFLDRAFDELDPADPSAITAVTNAIKTLEEIKLAESVINVRIAKYSRTIGAESGEVAPQKFVIERPNDDD